MEVAGSELRGGSEPGSLSVRPMLCEFPPWLNPPRLGRGWGWGGVGGIGGASLGCCSPSSWTRLRTVRSLQLPQALPLFALCVYLLGLRGLHNILQGHKRPQRPSHALPGEVRVQKRAFNPESSTALRHAVAFISPGCSYDRPPRRFPHLRLAPPPFDLLPG